MALDKQATSHRWWYRFKWDGELIRASTKQSNKRVAEQMEAAHKTSLAKGEVGIRDRRVIPTLRNFAEKSFLPFVDTTFSAKPNTRTFYQSGVKCILAIDRLAASELDAITTELIGAFVAQRQRAGLQISSINRELQALRRLFNLAQMAGCREGPSESPHVAG